MFGYILKGHELFRELDIINRITNFTNMYGKKYFKTESEFFKWVNYIEVLERRCKPGYHIKYVDPEKQELGVIIYDDEFSQLTPEAQQLYLELEED